MKRTWCPEKKKRFGGGRVRYRPNPRKRTKLGKILDKEQRRNMEQEQEVLWINPLMVQGREGVDFSTYLRFILESGLFSTACLIW